MAKYTLEVDNEYEYEMIGICSHHQDYRVIWELNHYLNFKFTKSTEFYSNYTKKGVFISEHSMYTFQDENTGVDYLFVKNKSQGKFLLAELSQIDFFIFLKDNFTIEVDVLLEKVRSVPSVVTAFAYNPEDYKSCEQLMLFE